MKRALVKTRVIARQKYDYIYFNSISLSNISYGLICVCSASDTQLIALRQGYDLICLVQGYSSLDKKGKKTWSD